MSEDQELQGPVSLEGRTTRFRLTVECRFNTYADAEAVARRRILDYLTKNGVHDTEVTKVEILPMPDEEPAVPVQDSRTAPGG